jgi:hypothetical protein
VLLDLLQQPYAVIGAIETTIKQSVAELARGDETALARASSSLASLSARLPNEQWAVPIRAQVDALSQQLADSSGSIATAMTSLNLTLASLPAHWRAAMTVRAQALSDGFQKTLSAIATTTAGGIEEFRLAIERWYDEGMDRVSGWYKRWTQAIQFGLGLALALLLNVDTLRIANEVSANDALHKALAAQAQAYAEAGSLSARIVTMTDPAATGGVELVAPEARRFTLRLPAPEGVTSPWRPVDVRVAPSDELRPYRIECQEPTPPTGSITAHVELACQVNARVPSDVRGSLTVSYKIPSAEPGREPVERSTAVPVQLVPDADALYAQVEEQLRKTSLPIGWDEPPWKHDWKQLLLSILGCLLTALAGSLGAPFWFDLLKKVANLRGSGPKPEEQTRR